LQRIALKFIIIFFPHIFDILPKTVFSPLLLNHLRDYLRGHPDAVDEYSALKKDLTEREWSDVNEYADAKTEFIKDIKKKAKG
jgi:hypothetical protein